MVDRLCGAAQILRCNLFDEARNVDVEWDKHALRTARQTIQTSIQLPPRLSRGESGGSCSASALAAALKADPIHRLLL